VSDRIRVADAADLGPDDRALVTVDGAPVAVVNYDGEYYAIENTCLHQCGPLAKGRVKGALTGEWDAPGERVDEFFDEERPAIACPLHGWEYDLETGDHLGADDLSLSTYPVVVEDGVVYVDA